MSPPQLRLALGDEVPEPPPEAPQIYVASPLTHLDVSGRDAVLAWADIIESAVREATLESEDAWPVRVHVPARLSAPWSGDRLSDRSVFERNSLVLWTDADALIVIAHSGGSLGAGQEFEWARGVSIPVLYLHRSHEPVSRQIKGTPADLVLGPFSSPDELRDHVTAFIRTRRALIEDGPRRRDSVRLRFTPLTAGLGAAWRAKSAMQRREVVAVTGLPEWHVERIVSDPLALAAVPFARAASLIAGLGFPFGLLRPALPQLGLDQLRALLDAQAEYEWDDSLATELLSLGRYELARGGTRRLTLSTIEGWRRLHLHRHA